MRVILFVLWIAGGTLASCVRSDIAPGVQPDAIKQIEIGMELGSVIELLGLPYRVEALHGIHSLGCTKPQPHLDQEVHTQAQILGLVEGTFNSAVHCCDGNAHEKKTKRYSLVYSRMPDPEGISPMLWVHMDEHDHVYKVYARLLSHVAWIEDKGIYLLSRNGYHCDDALLGRYY